MNKCFNCEKKVKKHNVCKKCAVKTLKKPVENKEIMMEVNRVCNNYVYALYLNNNVEKSKIEDVDILGKDELDQFLVDKNIYNHKLTVKLVDTLMGPQMALICLKDTDEDPGEYIQIQKALNLRNITLIVPQDFNNFGRICNELGKDIEKRAENENNINKAEKLLTIINGVLSCIDRINEIQKKPI